MRYSATQALKDSWMIRFDNKKLFENTMNMHKTLDNLKTYKNTKQFQNVVWTVIAQYLVSKQEQEEVLKTFQLLDLNGDGRLSKEELISGYEKIYAGNREKAIAEVDRIMRHVDQNKNNFIEYSGLFSI
jgi:calcium-dependent protein kinase